MNAPLGLAELAEQHGHRYAKLPVLVARDARVSLAGKGLFALLDSYTGDNGCYPAQATLSAAAGCSVDTVQRALAELENAGYVSVAPRYDARGLRCGVRYTLCALAAMYERRAARAYVDLDEEKPTVPTTPHRRGVRHRTGAASDTAPVRSDQPIVYKQAQNPLSPVDTGEPAELAGNRQVPATNRAERAELDSCDQWIGTPCAACQKPLEQNGIIELVNGRRIFTIERAGRWETYRQANGKLTRLFFATSAYHSNCPMQVPAKQPAKQPAELAEQPAELIDLAALVCLRDYVAELAELAEQPAELAELAALAELAEQPAGDVWASVHRATKLIKMCRQRRIRRA